MSKWSNYLVYRYKCHKEQYKSIFKQNMKMRKFMLFLPILFFLGCKTVPPISNERDSVRIETVTKHDTIFQTKADSASLDALLHCDSNYNVVLDELATVNGERIRLSAELKNMRTKSSNNTPQFAFNVDCKEDSLQHRIEWLEKELQVAIKEKETDKVEVTPRWAWWSLIACVCFVALFIVRIIIKIYAR